MEFEQIIKRMDYLEKQQRETKETLAALKETVAAFDTSVNAVSKQIKTLSKQLTEITPVTNRVDQFENLIGKQRTEIIKMIEEVDKSHNRSEKEITKEYQSRLTDLEKAINQLKIATDLTDIKKQLKDRANEVQRMVTTIADFKTSVDEAKRANEDVRLSIKASEEARKNDLKRIADVQGEITALRKRIEESREKNTMQADTIRNIENRITELLASELERKQAQAVFLDQQRIALVDRERSWKGWEEKFNSFQKEAEALEVQVQKLDETMRSAKKAQETYMELNTKLERRINEVTEMQRLAEERLRQEWVSFKADDQKRWTGYSLSSEENFRDIRKEVGKYEGSITALNEVSQVLQDQLHQTTDASEKQLQEMMNVIHEWMTSYQRIMGHGKKPAKK